MLRKRIKIWRSKYINKDRVIIGNYMVTNDLKITVLYKNFAPKKGQDTI